MMRLGWVSVVIGLGLLAGQARATGAFPFPNGESWYTNFSYDPFYNWRISDETRQFSLRLSRSSDGSTLTLEKCNGGAQGLQCEAPVHIHDGDVAQLHNKILLGYQLSWSERVLVGIAWVIGGSTPAEWSRPKCAKAVHIAEDVLRYEVTAGQSVILYPEESFWLYLEQLKAAQ
jgi:hypothetical protein